MPLIVTPNQLSLSSELYHQLGQLIAAGIPLPAALETIERNPPSRSLRRPIRSLLAYIKDGYTFSDAMVKVKGALPSFDIALLQAGDQSGRLDQCFKLLAEYYREKAVLQRSVISNLLYPIFVLHFAFLLFPTELLTKMIFDGAWLPWVMNKVMFFGPLYAIVFLVIYACQGKHGAVWRGLLEQVGRLIPLVGKARRSLALARLATSLEALLNAGVNIITAWEMAAAASGSPAILRRVTTWRPKLENEKMTPSELINAASEFPTVFANLYHSGEISGQIDDTLQRIHAYYKEEASRKMALIADWLPRILYLLIVIKIGMFIVGFYSGYFGNIEKTIEP